MSKQTNILPFQGPHQVRRTPIADAVNLTRQSNVRVSKIPDRFEGPVPLKIPGINAPR